MLGFVVLNWHPAVLHLVADHSAAQPNWPRSDHLHTSPRPWAYRPLEASLKLPEVPGCPQALCPEPLESQASRDSLLLQRLVGL